MHPTDTQILCFFLMAVPLTTIIIAANGMAEKYRQRCSILAFIANAEENSSTAFDLQSAQVPIVNEKSPNRNDRSQFFFVMKRTSEVQNKIMPTINMKNPARHV